MAKRLPGIAALLFLLTVSLPAGEGMWLPDAFQSAPLDSLRSAGFVLDPASLAGTDSNGLISAVVLLGGGTGSFISSTGLILTNHHVVFGAIQSLSTVDHDYLRDGFLARTPAEELSIPTTAEIVLSIKDVTAEVLDSVAPGMPDAEQTSALQARMRALEASARGSGNLTCRVSELYQGARYVLFTSIVLRDLRLVYAPPSSIGNFGGETDNWIWPRHTGDFSILRAYVGPGGQPAAYAPDNVPYVPRRFLPLSLRGARPGDFALVLGFPGRTYRHREAASVAYARDVELPAAIRYYKIRMDAMERTTRDDRRLQILYASRIRRLANPYKKYLGILEGMRRADLPAERRRQEERLASWIASSTERRAAYGGVLEGLERANDTLRSVGWKNAFFSNLNGVDLVAAAQRLLTYVEGFPDDEQGRRLPPTDEQRAAMHMYITDLFATLDPAADRAVLTSMILAAGELPESQRVETFGNLLDQAAGMDREERVRRYVDDLFEESDITSLEGCLHLLDGDADDILDDPFVHLAAELGREQAEITARVIAQTTALTSLRRRYVRAWLACEPDALPYPDANRTLRLSYGTVRDLRPRDAVELSAQTFLRGVLEKASPQETFTVPERLRRLWEQKDFGRFADSAVGDVPVAFIADLDITGGNSGSPVINDRGELIGCAFDGNWEGVVGDYVYQERTNRCISVDVRYILFLLDRFAGAERTLSELTIR